MTDRPDFEMTVAHAAEHGSRRELLLAIRRRLADALDDDRTQPRDLSPLALRLKEVAEEIQALDTAGVAEATTATANDEPYRPERT